MGSVLKSGRADRPQHRPAGRRAGANGVVRCRRPRSSRRSAPGRVNDAQLKALFRWIDANAERTSLPLRDLVEFALATGMRRGEILALRWDDIDGRVATIKRKHPKERDRIERVPLLKKNANGRASIRSRSSSGSRRPARASSPMSATRWVSGSSRRARAPASRRRLSYAAARMPVAARADRKFDPLRLALVGGHRDLRNVKRYAKLDPEAIANE